MRVRQSVRQSSHSEKALSPIASDRNRALTCGFVSALGGIRTTNLLIRSQVLYPLSYERWAPTDQRQAPA
jgi:hypothetical protein